MRPRSRLLSKRRLTLPTIREGSEETVRDLNEANTLYNAGHCQAVSSEDYLLSICHLAHPTFPTRDASPDSFHAQLQDTAQQKLRPSWVEYKPKEEARAAYARQAEGKKLNRELKFGNSDPLEYIYGHQNTFSNLSGGRRRAFVEGRFMRQHGSVWESHVCVRTHGITLGSNPDFPQQREGSCSELNSKTDTSVPNISPKHTMAMSEASTACRKAEGERLNPAIKQSLISQWISDCKLAWREARTRACMLPAIAEV